MPFLVPVSKPRQAFHGEYSSSLDHPGPDHGITSTASIHPLSPHGDQYHGKEYHGRHLLQREREEEDIGVIRIPTDPLVLIDLFWSYLTLWD
jgi:hypothetical protein